METLKVSLWPVNPEVFENVLYLLLHSLHYHPEIRTLILDSNNFPVTDIKQVSKLLLYNSNITTVFVTKFTLIQVKSIVPCLVFNGRRTEFDCFSNLYSEVDSYIETFQREVKILCLTQC